jgi:hypothetical protein
MPFDKYAPSIAPKVLSRTCPVCRHYFPSKKALSDHKKAKICANYAAQVADDSSDDDNEIAPPPPITAFNDDNTGWPVLDEENDKDAVRFDDENSIEL